MGALEEINEVWVDRLGPEREYPDVPRRAVHEQQVAHISLTTFDQFWLGIRRAIIYLLKVSRSTKEANIHLEYLPCFKSCAPGCDVTAPSFNLAMSHARRRPTMEGILANGGCRRHVSVYSAVSVPNSAPFVGAKFRIAKRLVVVFVEPVWS
jgi:hypothetical protein